LATPIDQRAASRAGTTGQAANLSLAQTRAAQRRDSGGGKAGVQVTAGAPSHDPTVEDRVIAMPVGSCAGEQHPVRHITL
jgi:hypothetical protein